MRNVRNYLKRFDVSFFLTLFCIFAIPFFVALSIIAQNNRDRFSSFFQNTIFLLLILFIFIFIIGIVQMLRKKRILNKRHLKKKVGFSFIVLSYLLEILGIVNLIYYNDDFKNWLIHSSMGSIHHQHVATAIYSRDTIEDVIQKGMEKIDFSEDLIPFDDISYHNPLYANAYEEEILEREEDALYKIIKVSGTVIGSNYHYEGYMAVIYDPSHVHLAKSSGAGTFDGSYGETLVTISKKNNALVAMNAGGFYDPDWNSNGGIPHGDVFIDGKLQSTFRRGLDSGGLIGFDQENKLILKRMTSDEAKETGIRDAVDWGPYLIVNGHNYYREVDYYTWACARTVIGQREDGIVLMLVIDGSQEHSKGATYADVASIMEKYGAVNAASLDGGTSTSMTENHQYVNSPWNGYVKTYRWLPNAWVVTE